MSRYRFSKHSNLGPVHGFTIHTPDGGNLKDLHPQFIVRELNRLNNRIKRLEDAGDALEYASVILEAGEDPNGFEKLLITQRKWRKAKEDKL